MEPSEITIIVHSARNLQGKKKGRHKYSVVFGVGTNRYRTAVNQDSGGNPEWTEESLIEVDNPQHPLVFVVREKDDVLGQVTLPLSCLPRAEKRSKRHFPLQPHRKAPCPQGTLVFEAWVSKYVAESPKPPEIQVTCKSQVSPIRSNPFQALKVSITCSPMMARRSKSSVSKTTTVKPNLLRRNSRSLQDLSDLTSLNAKYNTTSPAEAILAASNQSSIMIGLDKSMNARRSRSSAELGDDVNAQQPEILSVSPAVGTLAGGTQLSITGNKFGTRKEDVVGLFICSANCLSTLEYVSPHELRCTTKPWKACKGYITIETQSGGKATSFVQYTFVEAVKLRTETDLSHISTEPAKKSKLYRLSVPEPKCKDKKQAAPDETLQELVEIKHVNMELRMDIKLLTEENIKLREQNETLKLYVDHLVARVMEECPEALSAGTASAAVALMTR